MTQKKKLFYNTISSFAFQFIALVNGFILPYYLLKYFGSEINGLINSITHFLGFISLAECGVGAVVQSALYKPLAEKNDEEISEIIISAEKFFHKIGIILIIYTIVISVVYPLFVKQSFGELYIRSLILIIAISIFIQYFFSISYSLLLEADALAYITLTAKAIVLVLNTVFSILLMKIGAGVHIVRLCSSIIFIVQPFIYRIYVKKHYKLNKKMKLINEPIKQKWNGLAQHIAANVLSSTDTVVLSLFSTLQNVSIYSVYYLVVTGVRQIITSLTAGFQPLLGNLYFTEKKEDLNKVFNYIEWFFHTISIYLFTSTSLLIVPFIKIYTKEIMDANYIAPVFGTLLCLAICAYCIRLPYNMMVLAVGHYKQTQMSCIIEAVLNIVISVVLVIKFGLVGVAIGTFVAMVYRTFYLAHYLSESILYRNINYFLKHILVDCILACCIYFAASSIKVSSISYILWIKDAFVVAIIGLLIIIIINMIFYKNETIKLLLKIKSIINKRVHPSNAKILK